MKVQILKWKNKNIEETTYIINIIYKVIKSLLHKICVSVNSIKIKYRIF